MPTVQQSERE